MHFKELPVKTYVDYINKYIEAPPAYWHVNMKDKEHKFSATKGKFRELGKSYERLNLRDITLLGYTFKNDLTKNYQDAQSVATVLKIMSAHAGKNQQQKFILVRLINLVWDSFINIWKGYGFSSTVSLANRLSEVLKAVPENGSVPDQSTLSSDPILNFEFELEPLNADLNYRNTSKKKQSKKLNDSTNKNDNHSVNKKDNHSTNKQDSNLVDKQNNNSQTKLDGNSTNKQDLENEQKQVPSASAQDLSRTNQTTNPTPDELNNGSNAKTANDQTNPANSGNTSLPNLTKEDVEIDDLFDTLPQSNQTTTPSNENTNAEDDKPPVNINSQDSNQMSETDPAKSNQSAAEATVQAKPIPPKKPGALSKIAEKIDKFTSGSPKDTKQQGARHSNDPASPISPKLSRVQRYKQTSEENQPTITPLFDTLLVVKNIERIESDELPKVSDNPNTLVDLFYTVCQPSDTINLNHRLCKQAISDWFNLSSSANQDNLVAWLKQQPTFSSEVFVACLESLIKRDKDKGGVSFHAVIELMNHYREHIYPLRTDEKNGKPVLPINDKSLTETLAMLISQNPNEDRFVNLVQWFTEKPEFDLEIFKGLMQAFKSADKKEEFHYPARDHLITALVNHPKWQEPLLKSNNELTNYIQNIFGYRFWHEDANQAQWEMSWSWLAPRFKADIPNLLAFIEVLNNKISQQTNGSIDVLNQAVYLYRKDKAFKESFDPKLLAVLPTLLASDPQNKNALRILESLIRSKTFTYPMFYDLIKFIVNHSDQNKFMPVYKLILGQFKKNNWEESLNNEQDGQATIVLKYIEDNPVKSKRRSKHPQKADLVKSP